MSRNGWGQWTLIGWCGAKRGTIFGDMAETPGMDGRDDIGGLADWAFDDAMTNEMGWVVPVQQEMERRANGTRGNEWSFLYLSGTPHIALAICQFEFNLENIVGLWNPWRLFMPFCWSNLSPTVLLIIVHAFIIFDHSFDEYSACEWPLSAECQFYPIFHAVHQRIT
jgi:hypothetical protein